ncbi:MAG: GAF domain-containing sensor histidine kinase [Gemmatimonadaceae bacterium]
MASTIRQTWHLPDTELRPALSLALAIEHAPMGVLMLRSETSDALEPVVSEGLTDDQCLRFAPTRPGHGPVGLACAEHRRVTIPDVLLDGDGLPGLREMARGIGFRGLDVVPLTLDDGKVIGAMAALFPGVRKPSARSGRLAEWCGRLMAIAFDNARKRAESERRREAAEDMARARVEYIARMSHELRTPLQSITGYLELLRVEHPESLSDRQQEMLDRVRASEQVLIQAISDLGTMARLEAGRLEYLVVPVAASRAMTTAVSVVEPLAEQKGIALKAVSSGNCVAQADEMKLIQILVNLLANAVKFTPSGGAIRVSCRAEKNAVCFEVADTGPGIPESTLEHVFEPFIQLASLTSQTHISGIAGSGLGLAISREFAQGMNGSLSATSMPGNGAVFSLRLPLA